MSQSTYAYLGSRLHLVLDDDLAHNYNNAMTRYINAQSNYEVIHGTPWDPTEPLGLSWTEDELHAWDKVARLINLLIEINGGTLEIMPEECTSNMLVQL